jgi:hypothetical protein
MMRPVAVDTIHARTHCVSTDVHCRNVQPDTR